MGNLGYGCCLAENLSEQNLARIKNLGPLQSEIRKEAPKRGAPSSQPNQPRSPQNFDQEKENW